MTGTFFLISYALLDNRSKNALPAIQAVGFTRPVWVNGLVPIKGPNFLRKFEAKNSEELAVTRLKALKLIVWATLLFWSWELLFNRGLYGALEFPGLTQAINDSANGTYIGFSMRWILLIVRFFTDLVRFAAVAHLYVAIVRMAGFRIPRSLVSPLSSKSLSEYWGRYFFYFKEMLADVFFFPAFQRYFKSNYHLRIAFATIAAAFFGNVMFDLIPRFPEMATVGFWEVLEDIYSYSIYAAFLTAGLIVSQLRKPKTNAERGWFAEEVWTRVQVIGFFVLLEVFDDSLGTATVEARYDYFLGLFGI